AMAVTMAEMIDFGEDYATQTIKNARALAGYLAEEGFSPLAESKGYTKSHQVIVDVRNQGGGAKVAESLEKANIILNKNLLPWDDVKTSANPSGIRIGVSEMTHFGMKEPEMQELAGFIGRVAVKGEAPEAVKADVNVFRSGFLEVKYCY
ncbi:MAG: serine hydroxymethyltransferase, partial [Candidatus Aenigmarchaeota archaeon]|nr:serine hydroxymethyltransferase [Candidatus Aenigmarchaeota archaeon]